MQYSLSWQSTGLQNRLSQVRVLHTAPSRRAARTLPGNMRKANRVNKP